MNIWALIPLITSTAYIILVVLMFSSIRKRANRIFAFYLGIAACWSFSSFMLHVSTTPERALLWNEILAVLLASTLIAYFHFIRAYLNRPAGLGTIIGYLLIPILAFFSFRGDVVKKATVVNGILDIDFGIGLYILGVGSIIFIVPVVFQLVKKYRSSIDPEDRNRTVYLITGWIILVISTYTNMLPTGSSLPIDHIGSLINAIIIAYAISRFHLLDVRLIIRRGLAYTILAIILVGVSIGAILLGRKIFPEEQTIMFMAVILAVILFLVIFARPLVRVAQRAVDRVFYGEAYMSREALLTFNSRMGNIIDLNQLAEAMLPPVSKALRINQARLMFQQNGGGNFITMYTYPKERQDEVLSFSLDNPIIALLQKQDDPLDLKQIDALPQLKGLWQVDKERLAASELEFMHPIKSRGRLIGILALGKKKSNRLYLSEDIELIKSMSNQAGIIIDNARLYSQAVTWANTDGLTELYNHRHFHERLDQEIARGSRFGSIFSLILLDLDHFKTFNDNYGHLAGDEVLRRVGRCLENSVRSVDMTFRYGGEEFAVILPGTRLNDALKAAERIRNMIEAKASPATIPVTASLGVATWPIDGMTKQDIIGRADTALYQAKQSGRNRVVLSSEVVKGQTSLIGMELETKERAVSIIYALAATVDAKDHYTYGHSKKVSQYAVTMSEALGLTPQKIATIRAAGLLHDIGKIAVPDSILNKAGPLTDEEWEPIKAHPELGMEILKHVIDLVNCLPAILHHHEHYDGSGYPGSLKGEEIPVEARILAIADAYDAITSIRPYHNQLTPQEALDELKRCAGTQFDPELVKVFCQAIENTLPKHIEVE